MVGVYRKFLGHARELSVFTNTLYSLYHQTRLDVLGDSMAVLLDVYIEPNRELWSGWIYELDHVVQDVKGRRKLPQHYVSGFKGDII